jgi:crotonobetainyl-CoA:carnitine CoA-transferase CaiB-like acyl-CoA transferase
VSGALAGVRVLDLCDQKGAFAGKLLAGLGADVILVEPPGGSPLREIPPFLDGVSERERSLFFWFYAAGKRGITLDLAHHTAPALLRRLAAAVDVVIESEPPGRLAALGCGADDLRAVKPRLVVASITPFGQHGPRREWRASDLVAQALGGMLSVNGRADGPPLGALGLQAYHQAGIMAAIGILSALMARDGTGRGQDVDVSLQAAVTGALEHVPGFWHQDGRIGRRQGTLHWTRYFRVGRCRDGWVMHCTLGDWTSLVEWMKADGIRADVLDDPSLDEPKNRQAAAERVFDVLDAWAARYTVAELVEGAQLRRIPYAAVRAPEALLDDPHLAERGFFVPIEHPELGVHVPCAGAPFLLTDAPWRVARPPRLGEHTAEVFAELLDAVPPRALTSASPRAARPLEGIRVLDFTWVVAGPVTTRILADLGADVIKVERRASLDFGDRRGGLSGSLMRGKRSLVLDLNDPRGLDLARRLAAVCDVVIDNFSARVMTNLGLDYESVRTLRPDIVCVRMTGFGLTGPNRDHVSYGPTLQAITGYTLLMAEPGGPPAGFGYSYSDLAGGNLGALAVLAALWHRRRTGRGQLVDLAQLEAVASLLGPLLLARAMDGGVSAPVGNASQELPGAPHGVYPCAGDDRWLAIAVLSDDDWARFVAAVGWTPDPRFVRRADRLAHSELLDGLVSDWTRGQRAETAMELLQRAGVACGLVADAEDLCVRDPQLAARGHFVDVASPEGRTVRLDGPPFLLSDTPARVSGPGPLLGEHGDAVLQGLLGLDTAELERLRDDGVLG